MAEETTIDNTGVLNPATSSLITIYDVLLNTAQRHPLSIAFADEHVQRTYKEFSADVMEHLATLRSLGIGKGARVALWGQKSYSYVTILTALFGSEYIVIPINSALKPDQVRHIINDAASTLLFADQALLNTLQDNVPESVRFTYIFSSYRSQIPSSTGIRTGNHIEWRASGSRSPRLQHITENEKVVDDDPCCILYTSGSTGTPKGVVLSHRNLVAGAFSVAEYLELNSEDAILGVLPLSFDAGLSQLTTSIASGAKFVPINYLFPNQVPRACRKFSITSITAVPPLWIQLIDVPWDEHTAGRIRRFASTGGKMPSAVLTELRRIFSAAKPYLMYGLTEAFRSTYLDPAQIDNRPGSIGKSVPNTQILVLRPDGTECAENEPGELVHRGAFVTLGYWNNSELTDFRYRLLPSRYSGLRGGVAVWSGDIVKKDADGYLYFLSRADDMIKSMGYRISPTEIEDVIYASGMIREVAVFGQDDMTRGQRIIAIVVSKSAPLSLEALNKHCHASLPSYMCPTEYIQTSQIQRGPNGKFDRSSLKHLLSNLAE